MHITPPSGSGSDNPSDARSYAPEPAPGQSKALLAGLIVLAVVSIGGMIGLYLYNQSLEQRLNQVQQSVQASLQQSGDQLQQLINRIDQSDARHAQLQGELAQTQTKLGSTQTDLQKTRQAAEQLAQQQQQDAQQISGQLGQLQQQQQQTQGNLGSLSTDVVGVKGDVKSTQEQLAATRSELQHAIGDLGVQSGLIAKNHDDLEALRALGDRDIVEFDLKKSAKRQHVGSVQLELKSTDQKRQKYTVELVADDKTIEKKDKTALEPVQFYRVGDHQPTEIVVQQVLKDRIVGYVSSPKRAATTSAPSKG